MGVGRGADWKLKAGPRLHLDESPFSTTVADVNGDGIPDILVVSQEDNVVVVLKGIGGGFFDDQDPLEFPTGDGPIRAFVGRFDADPGLDLAVLDSGSGDLTYYSDFMGGTAKPRFISTGGLDPIAGVMGPAVNGYNDLFIAHEGTTSITEFEGGLQGLVLTNTVFLGSSVKPTDLVISGGDSGNLDLYVSVQGQDRVILVTITLGSGMSNPVTGVGNSSAPSTSSPGAGSSGGASSSANGLISLRDVSTEPSAQGRRPRRPRRPPPVRPAHRDRPRSPWPTSSRPSSRSSAPPSARPPSSIISSRWRRCRSPTSCRWITAPWRRSRSCWSSRVHRVRVQPATAPGCPRRPKTCPAQSVAIELASSIERNRPGGGSNLERFLSDLEGDLGVVAGNIFGATDGPTGPPPEWVWQPRVARQVAVADDGEGRAVDTNGPKVQSPLSEPLIETEKDTVTDNARVGGPDHDGEKLRSESRTEADAGLTGWARVIGSVLVGSYLVLTGMSAYRKRRARRSRPTTQPIRRPHLARRSIGSRPSGAGPIASRPIRTLSPDQTSTDRHQGVDRELTR